MRKWPSFVVWFLFLFFSPRFKLVLTNDLPMNQNNIEVMDRIAVLMSSRRILIKTYATYHQSYVLYNLRLVQFFKCKYLNISCNYNSSIISAITSEK
jgi:hypothetical protein